MAKPLEDAYDPTDSSVLADILKTNASRRRPAYTATESSETVLPTEGSPVKTPGATDNMLSIQQDSMLDDKQDIQTSSHQDSVPTRQVVSNMTRHQDDNQDIRLASKIVSKSSRQQANKVSSQTDSKLSGQPMQQLHWRDVQLSEAPRILVSFRIPEPLNDWIEDYVHAHRKEGINKQDVLAWAIGVLQQQISAEEGR